MTGLVTIRLARRQHPPQWLGILTSAHDVTLVTVLHATIFLSGFASMALSSRVTFSLYIFVIFGTGLRCDGRLCAATGLLAAAQWLTLIAWAQFAGVANAAAQDGRFYGDIALGG